MKIRIGWVSSLTLVVCVLAIGFLLWEWKFFVCTPKVKTTIASANGYIEKELAIIKDHAKVLQKEGRMPVDFWGPERVLGQYGWHSSGLTSRGSFGAYSFHQKAFEQAKRSWWVHGLMEAGSDLLITINRNASFVKKCNSWASSDGASGEDCQPEMNSPVGFRVGNIYKGPKDAIVVEVVDGRTLRLNKKSPGLALRYDQPILPPDYVDMCECSITSSQ